MVKASPSLQRLWQRGCDFLGTELAIMGGAMTWVSERNLVAAISNGGGFGVIACGSRDPAELDAANAGAFAPAGAPIRRESHHSAPAAQRAHRCLRPPAGGPRRAGRRVADGGRGAANQRR